ncbi:hypothetical protein ACYFX5_05750 [Bremerella sp. T1]|uniref:hypothetical protein n=1 Tax=Bremerella sp. TYQ1 TaxID=3119568 RepID=UPI001CCA7EEB|nr:hypothetical protein [Bremerella volcania]UBM37762.1 hypothetical protein LA756_07690 [Bremerella volcania]
MNRFKQLTIWTLVGVLALSVPAVASAEWYNPMSWMSSSSSKKSKSPSTLQKLNKGTKDFFSTTADYMNPFNDADDHKKKQRYSYNGGYRSSKKKEESSWFGGWFSSEPEPGPPETISDFMDLERPKF